jgi:hypothetical protein
MSGNLPQPDPTPTELVAQFVENQSKELAQRAQELQLERHKEDNAFQFGKEALAAQERDRKDERACERDQRKDRLRAILIGLGIVSALLLGTTWLERGDIALELAKTIALLAAGAAGGYGYAKSKEKDGE